MNAITILVGRRSKAAAVGALLAAFVAGPALADAVVLQSTAPELSPGTVVSADTPIAVPDGERAVFLTEAGVQIAVDGPYEGAVPDGEADLPDGWEALLGSSEVDMRDVGATRALELEDEATESPDGDPPAAE